MIRRMSPVTVIFAEEKSDLNSDARVSRNPAPLAVPTITSSRDPLFWPSDTLLMYGVAEPKELLITAWVPLRTGPYPSDLRTAGADGGVLPHAVSDTPSTAASTVPSTAALTVPCIIILPLFSECPTARRARSPRACPPGVPTPCLPPLYVVRASLTGPGGGSVRSAGMFFSGPGPHTENLGKAGPGK